MKRNAFSYIRGRLGERGTLAVMLTYTAFCLFSIIWFSFNFSARNIIMSSLYILFAPLILLAEYILKIRCGELFSSGVLFIAAGSILGSCFNLYTALPFFDTLLHGMSGVLFAALGFALAERFFGRLVGGRAIFGAILFAFCFSLAIAVIWELFEYFCTVTLGFDMMEDTVVNSIRSYLLAGTHNELVVIDGIVKTVIHYGDGLTYTVEGYLDLGLIDTVIDMLVCTVGALIFSLVGLLSYRRAPGLLKMLTPSIDTGRNI